MQNPRLRYFKLFEFFYHTTSSEQWLEMRNSRDSHVKELSKLSKDSKFILDPTSGHGIEHDDPNLVAEMIQEMMNKLSPGLKCSR